MNQDEFNKAYLSILLEGVNNEKIKFKPKDYDDFLNALKTIHLVYEESNIINESSEFDKLINEIFICKNGQNFSKETLLKLIGENYVNYEEFKNKSINLKVFKFDFLKLDDFEQNLRQYFWHLNDNECTLEYSKILMKNTDNCAGFTLNLEDVYFIFLNTNKYTYETCLHEFHHYLEDLKISQNEEINVDKKFDKNKLKYLNLNEEQILFIENNLKSSEIYQYLFEFIHTFETVYEKYFKNNKFIRTKNEFIEYVIFLLTRKNKNPLESDIVKMFININDDISSILIFIASFLFLSDFSQIESFIKNQFTI